MFEPVVHLVQFVQLTVFAAAGWQHWIMFKFKETVKTNESKGYYFV